MSNPHASILLGAQLHRQIVNAFRSHWKVHNNAYPQKFLLTGEQEEAFHAYLLVSKHNDPKYAPPRGQYFDRPLEVSGNTAGEMIAIDGTSTPLAGYDEMK